jgi:hypothetical protein
MKKLKTIKKELIRVRQKKAERQIKKNKYKVIKDWVGLIFCADNGFCSISDENSEPIWLGMTKEIIPLLKKENVDCNNLDEVVKVVDRLNEEKERLFRLAEKELKVSPTSESCS